MVDQQLRILAEELVKFVLVMDRASCHIAHREHTVFFELLCDSSSHSPEVGERLMRPQGLAIAHLIQLGNADTVLICRNVLCYDVHSHFAEEKVCADTGCCGDTGCLKDIQNDFHCKITGRELVSVQVVRDIHEHLVDGIHNDVFRRDVLHVDFVNPRAVLHVISHPRRRDDEVNRKLRIGLQLGEKV